MKAPINMTPAELKKIGEAIYGARWRRALARDVDRSPKMVRIYVAGLVRIPVAVADAVRDLAAMTPEGAIAKKVLKKRLQNVNAGYLHSIAKEIGEQIAKDR